MCRSDKIEKLFKLFSFTDNARNKIQQAEKYLYNHKHIFWIIFIPLIIIFVISALNQVFLLGNITGIVIIILVYIKVFLKMFSSLRCFLGGSILFSVMLSIITGLIINSLTYNPFIIYLIEIISFRFIWTFISLIADNKISTISNELYAISFSVILIIKDSVINIIEYIFHLTINDFEAVAIDMIVVPLVIINSVSTVMCLLKGYYIEKYGKNEIYVSKQ